MTQNLTRETKNNVRTYMTTCKDIIFCCRNTLLKPELEVEGYKHINHFKTRARIGESF